MKYKIKLLPRTAHASGFSYNSPEITLLVRTSFGNITARFKVDTGADITAVPLRLAHEEGIDISPHAVQGQVTGLLGQTATKLRDWITFQIAGTQYRWPCDFIQSLPTPQRTPVLGRAGFLQEFTICMDDEYLTITCRHRSCSWWRRWWYKLRYGLFPTTWNPAQPLGEPGA